MNNASSVLLGFLLVFLFSPYAVAREIRDATGVHVRVSDSPRRIVTLAPSLAELVGSISDDDLGRIVGVSEYTDYPPALKKRTSIGPFTRINIETVLGLKPDLVLATVDGNSKDQVEHLRELKIPVVVVRTGTLSEIYESIAIVSEAMGERQRGDLIVKQLQTGIEHLRRRNASGTHPRVLLQIGSEPLVVAGKKSFLNEAVQVVGGVNVYQDSEATYPRPSYEDVVRRNPDVIIVLAMGQDPAPFKKMAGDWGRFSSLAAVRQKRVWVVVSDALLRPSPRLLEGLSSLEKAIHANR